MTDQIKAAAHPVAEAGSVLDIASDELASARRQADSVRQRRTALQDERAAMAATRQAGQEIDSGRLAIVVLDLEGVEPLVATAEAAIKVAEAKLDQARAAAANARQHLDHIRDTDLLGKLAAHADKLGELLLATVTEITAAESRLGRSRPEWFPTGALADRLRRLDLMSTSIPGARR